MAEEPPKKKRAPRKPKVKKEGEEDVKPKKKHYRKLSVIDNSKIMACHKASMDALSRCLRENSHPLPDIWSRNRTRKPSSSKKSSAKKPGCPSNTAKSTVPAT